MEIDGTYRLAVQTRVEQPLRIPQLGTLWKRQPHRVLEGLADADDAVVGPDGHPLGAGGLLPLHLFDYARVGAPDESPQLAQPLTPPASRPADYVIYLLGCGCVAHFDALLRMLSTKRTEGLSSLSLRWMQPSQQHRRRFPSNSSDCNRWMCWLLVSAFFGQSTQQIDSLRARGVRSSHAAVPVDLRSTRDLDRLVALTLDRYERVDILANNASELGPTPCPTLPTIRRRPSTMRCRLGASVRSAAKGATASIYGRLEGDSMLTWPSRS